ncbi:MAG: UDP-N-acetylglucosamine 2-epimerase (non-hydrolyzing) [Gemmatimonadota bacterium]
MANAFGAVTTEAVTRYNVAIVLGTRPEAIKMAPVIRELERRSDVFRPFVIATSQHREMLAQALAAFSIKPDVDLGLTHVNKTLAEFTARALLALTDAFTRIKPRLLMVQGDTSTVVAAALAAFYSGISIAHVEAGLRSGDNRRPFPEEANRRIASCVTDLHFAPTDRARRNLIDEQIPARDIYVTGNTIVDALRMMRHDGVFADPKLNAIPWAFHRTVLVTAHRREILSTGLRSVCDALRQLLFRYPDLLVVFPVHLNPRVREVVFGELQEIDRVVLLDPISYPDLIEVMRRSTLIMTDSGGIQEEGPSLKKPVLILRDVTERPEVVDSGFGRLVGTDPVAILRAASELLTDDIAYRRMISGANPFGDGHAAELIVDAIEKRLGADDLISSPAVAARMR